MIFCEKFLQKIKISLRRDVEKLISRKRYFCLFVCLCVFISAIDNSPAKLDSLQVLVEGHRFFRFPFRFTAGRNAPLFFRFSLSSVETHRFLTICRKILFLNKKKSTEFLQWTSVDNVDNYVLFYCFFRYSNILTREHLPELLDVRHVS